MQSAACGRDTMMKIIVLGPQRGGATPAGRAAPRRRGGAEAELRSWLHLVAAALALLALFHLLRSGGVQQQQQQGHSRVPEPLQPEAPLPPGFRFNKVVAIVAFDRYHYFQKVVAALQQAWGAEQYTVVIGIDAPPANQSTFDRDGWERTVELSKQLQWLAEQGQGFRQVLVNASATNLGLWANKRRTVAGAMSLSDFAVILEDDIVLEADALRWFEWHVTSGLIFRTPHLATATCWSKLFPADIGAAAADATFGVGVEAGDMLAARTLGLLDKYWANRWATPWGWALWRRTWDALGANWTGRDINLGHAVEKRGWVESMPLVARCNNIGAFGTNKRGASVGHIHQRAVTSGGFAAAGAALDRCSYRELPLGNASGPVPLKQLQQWVRWGMMSPDRRFDDVPLEELQRDMLHWVQEHPLPALWQSSC